MPLKDAPSQMHLQDSIRLMPYDHKAVCNQETAATPAMDRISCGFHVDFMWISCGFHVDFIWISWESGDMVTTGRTYHQIYAGFGMFQILGI